MNFPSILRKSCLMYRDNVAITFGDRRQTYAELGDRACRLANALSDLGLRPGDRVAVLADNQLETRRRNVELRAPHHERAREGHDPGRAGARPARP